MLDFKQITAKDNRLIKLISLLQKSSKARKENRLFVLEGLRICSDAAENGIPFDTLVLSKTVYEKMPAGVGALIENAKNGAVVGDGLFEKISDTTTPQGIIALCAMPNDTVPISKSGRYVALESVADPANIGAIARTAEALGIDGMIISGDSCDVYSPKALRASMGTLLRMPLYFCDSITSFLSRYSLRGFACIAQSDADLKIGDFAFSDGDVVIIGNEANGLSVETRNGAYKTATIDMRGKAESLNASAAAAIAMWELMSK
ncbi:MAG: RNA methyltransferase [Clostridia bacterium]|nr:RNA methyltransferase [Clostridia bacterium]